MTEHEDDRWLDALGHDFEPELAEKEGDAALLARAIAGATAPAPRARARWPWLLAAAALLVGAAAAAGAFKSAPPAVAPSIPPTPSPEASQATTAAPAPPPAESAAPPEAERPAPSAGAAAPLPSAAELFARANQARRDKKDAEAIRSYRELQRRYPDSREARASRVVLGQLLLDRTDAKEAVGEFDSYLQSTPGAVTEEALVGRARSLGKLGKTAEERATWQELLRRYPASVHAAEAKKRLAN